MLWLPIAAAAAGYAVYRHRFLLFGAPKWCYGKICWLDDKTPESEEELHAVRRMAKSGVKAYRLDPVTTVASFLNRAYLLPAYRGRDFLVEKVIENGADAWVFVSFADNTHMAFALHKPCIDGCRDIWCVKKYAYPDETLGC